jgi:hypothetical protein
MSLGLRERSPTHNAGSPLSIGCIDSSKSLIDQAFSATHRWRFGRTAAPEEEKLKLGKGAAFDKSRLKRLSQRDETWEADFRALPKPIDKSVTEYRGMVVIEW